MKVIATLAWIIAIIYATIPSYWLLVHPHITWWRARRARLVSVGPLWILMWFAVGAITWRWRLIAFYHSLWVWIPAVLLIACGSWIYSQARHDFSTDQVLGRSELQPDKHEQRLNADGIRARVRHPYYLAHACELLGWTIGTGLAVLYVLFAFAIVTAVFMIRAEERELEGRFGASYREYKRRVPAVIPRLQAVKSVRPE